MNTPDTETLDAVTLSHEARQNKINQAQVAFKDAEKGVNFLSLRIVELEADIRGAIYLLRAGKANDGLRMLERSLL